MKTYVRVGEQMSKNRQRRVPTSTSRLRSSGSSSGKSVSHGSNLTGGLLLISEKSGGGLPLGTGSLSSPVNAAPALLARSSPSSASARAGTYESSRVGE